MDKHTRNRRDGEYCEPMEWQTPATAFEVYNQPDNHWAPFTDKDKI